MAGRPASTSGETAFADLILHNGTVWTVDEALPAAEAVAVRGSRIARVGTDAEVLRLQGPGTQVIDLGGALLLPGFIDAHTHFGNAVGAFFNVRVVDVNDHATLAARLQEATRRVPAGMWITGFELSGHAAAAASKAGRTGFAPFAPSLAAVDQVTPDHPVLLSRYDGSHFINSAGLRLARLTKETPDPPNGEYQRDGVTGELTGLLLGSAAERTPKLLPPPSRARCMIAARAIVRDLNAKGIVGIHDIARFDEISQTQLYPVHVERSYTDIGVFEDLRAEGRLTVRVYPIITMANWRDYEERGIKPGSGDDLIRYGATKTFIDTSMMFEPFEDGGDWCGGFSFRVTDTEELRADIVNSDRLGFDAVAHVIGDRGHEFLLDAYDEAYEANPPRDRRFRLLHSWFPRVADIQRAGAMRLFVDVTPYHLVKQASGLDAALGEERAAGAFAWRTMIANGLRVNIGSDWPGSFDGASVEPNDPLENIYYAVTRRGLGASPDDGWRTEESLTVEEAVHAYTTNPAHASREEHIKGTVTEGKLADLVVLSQDIRTIEPEEILTTRVLYTVFDGRLVHRTE
ncbi:MAG: amidohydrolase [Actinoallomurus sp.]